MWPLSWWMRWWSEIDPRGREVAAARTTLEQARQREEELRAELEQLRSELAGVRREREAIQSDLAQLRTALDATQTELDEVRRDRDELRSEAERLRQQLADSDTEAEQAANSDRVAAAAVGRDGSPDVSRAASVLGTSVKANDLQVIEGIGPKIAELLDHAGFGTWQDLAGADPADLRRVLDEAGSRYHMHDPSSWPRQAALLADGRWQEFKELTEQIRSARAS